MVDDDEAVPSISSREELGAFLRTRSQDDARDIALRAVWRVLPIIRLPSSDIGNDELDVRIQRLTLAVFRATLVAGRGRSRAALAAYASASDAAHAYASDAARAARVAYAAGRVAYASASVPDAFTSASDASASASAASAAGADDDALDIWNAVQQDCVSLARNLEPLHSTPIWRNEPPWFAVSSDQWLAALRRFDKNWLLIRTWYAQVIINATIDPFPKQMLDVIANETEEFWGDGKNNHRTPAVVMADIAERLGWTPDLVRGSGDVPDVADLPEQDGPALHFTETPGQPVDVVDELSDDLLNKILAQDLLVFTARAGGAGGNLFAGYTETFSDYYETLQLRPSDLRSHNLWKLGNRLRRAADREVVKLERIIAKGDEEIIAHQEELVDGLTEFCASHNAYTASIAYCAQLDSTMNDPARPEKLAAQNEVIGRVLAEMPDEVVTPRARDVVQGAHDEAFDAANDKTLNAEQAQKTARDVSSNFLTAFLRKRLVEATAGVVGGGAYASAVWVANNVALFEELANAGVVSDKFIPVIRVIAKVGRELLTVL